MSPPVTIGLPVYNGAARIEQAIAAVIDQTYRNFTLLVSDNASDDGTWDILQKWAARDERIVLHRQESNIGALANFRFVLDHAESELFMWHAHDDWLAPNYLEELVGLACSDPKCTLVVSGVNRFEADSTFVRYRSAPAIDDSMRRRRHMIRMIRKPQPEWVYGLFRTASLRQAYTVASEFGYVWSWDHLLVLPFILNDQIRGSDKTIFNRSKLNQSRPLYCPRTLAGKVRFLARYTKLHFRVLQQSQLSVFKKLSYVPALLRRIHNTNGALNFKRWINHPFRQYVKQPLKRAAAYLQTSLH